VTDLDLSTIVAQLHTIRGRREPTRLRCRQDTAALLRTVEALVSAAQAMQETAASCKARKRLDIAIRLASSVRARPVGDGAREPVVALAAATAALLKALTGETVPPTKRVPEQLASRFRRRLAQGAWPPGTQIPTRVRLAKEAHVSVGTVSAAVKLLASEGLLIPIRGSGTYVPVTAQTRLVSTGLLRRGELQ
jgi:hypothetical protein